MSGIPRKRASLACSECNRRKLRCDKSIPCQRCVESGLGGSCARPGPVYRGRHSVSNDVDPSQRITQPGDELAVPEQSTSSSSPPNGVQLAVQQETFEIADREVTDAATILEFLAWGRRKEVSYATQLSPCVESPTLLLDDLGTVSGGHDVARLTRSGSDEAGHSVHLLQLLLPSRQKVYQLVNYHVNSLLWYHGSFHGPMFQRQLDDFYGKHKGDLSSPGLDLQWAALLFAVLTGSIACGNKASVLRWGFREPEQETLSHRWLDAVTTCLNIGQYMANASIRCCEAIATLTISAHILGYSDQQSILLASAVRIAQSLGLHRLNDCSPKSIERETGRRVWEQLCSQDWFSIPFSECYLINPLHSQTSEPLNCDDLTLQVIPPSQPTVTSYCRYLHLIAALMPQLQDSVATSNTLFTKYEQVLKFDRKMRNLASEQRPPYLGSAPIEPSWPRWISWARRALLLAAATRSS